ncbi:MAG: metallophosphoesterase [Candidatus Micrarchaeia archaeon]
MQKLKGIRFLYGKPALIATIMRERYLVLGDLHIGIELELSKKGIYLFDATEIMLEKIKAIMDEYALKHMIILGDIKNSIMRPTRQEAFLVKNFFDGLTGKEYDIKIILGNHDAHLDDLIDLPMYKELVIGGFAFLHGHAKPSKNVLSSKFIIAAHNHATALIRKNSTEEEKVWAIAHSRGNILVVAPAFNELIMGTPVGNDRGRSAMSAMLRNFNMKNVEFYTLYGKKLKEA